MAGAASTSGVASAAAARTAAALRWDAFTEVLPESYTCEVEGKLAIAGRLWEHIAHNSFRLLQD
ncbi:hypothetical protein GCM10017752_33400 [Streptomyces roseoviridis]